MDQILGYIERITFQNPDNGYTIAKIQERSKADVTCIVGTMPSVQPGETVRCFGEWKRHLIHGMQFEVKKHQVEAPADIAGIQKYLGSGLIKGIGPVYAKKIVEKFGIETLNIIDKTPEKLNEIGGIGTKKIERVKQCWDDQKAIREVMIFLQSHAVSPTYAQKIFKAYGNQTLKKLNENPYCLARDIFGIGFKTADSIAEKLGIEKYSTQRVEAGIEYILTKLSNDGHVCYPLSDFIIEAGQILEVDVSLVKERMSALQTGERIIIQEILNDGDLNEFIWSRSLFLSEKGIAKECRRLLRGKSLLRSIDIEKALDWVQKELKIELAGNQKIAVGTALREKLQIITGGPGTGKSTITNAILRITEKLTKKIYLAAPTGRAAKRMTEITGKKAYTIHSLLEYDIRAGGFKKNKESPLDCDLIVIDEASMIDTKLMFSLLWAIPTHARVIFVGDINQLPSVGPGNVLKDIIDSRCVPVTMLNEIFRQAAGSQIVKNAHLINSGRLPEMNNDENSDFFFVDSFDPEAAIKQILSLITQRIPKKYRFHPIDDIQVLAPMKKGVLGTGNLNTILQETLNPKDNPLIRFGQKFAVDDKVMQIRNNYDKNVFNGDIGRIAKIRHTEQEMMIRFDDREVIYDFSDLDEIILAYAVSIHKYQGSECPCVVIPIHTTHFKLLHRNLLYTGVTRGKKLVILVGSKKAVSIAVKNDEVKKRYTGLKLAIMEGNTPLPHNL